MKPNTLWFLMMWVLLASGVVNATEAGRASISVSDWQSAVEVAGVPSGVLFATGLMESGTTFGGRRQYSPWPWALNISGKSMFFESEQEAMTALEAEIKKGNEDVAVGMYQIFLKYNGDRVARTQDLLDPRINLFVAAQVLGDCGIKYPSVAGRLSCYYSGDLDSEGREYAERVLALTEQYGDRVVADSQLRWDPSDRGGSWNAAKTDELAALIHSPRSAGEITHEDAVVVLAGRPRTRRYIAIGGRE